METGKALQMQGEHGRALVSLHLHISTNEQNYFRLALQELVNKPVLQMEYELRALCAHCLFHTREAKSAYDYVVER